MKTGINCNIQLLQDMLAEGKGYILCEFYNLSKETILDGGAICIYIESSFYRKDTIFEKWEEFDKWFKDTFPEMDCK